MNDRDIAADHENVESEGAVNEMWMISTVVTDAIRIASVRKKRKRRDPDHENEIDRRRNVIDVTGSVIRTARGKNASQISGMVKLRLKKNQLTVIT